MSRRVVILVLAGLLTAGCSTGDEGDGRGPASTEGSGMNVRSSAFDDGATVPVRYTCDGTDVSPPLHITGVPADAVSLVLIMDDPDAPRGTWDHWVAYDIPVTEDIPEAVGELGTGGQNSWGRSGYGGPCPPSGTHRYIFAVYALDTMLGLDPGADKGAVLDALEGRVLAQATLTGRYGR
jgi:Raf kinase inhibitor-like YbhB/YbcL family protein